MVEAGCAIDFINNPPRLVVTNERAEALESKLRETEAQLAAAQNAAVQGFEEWWKSVRPFPESTTDGELARAAWQAATAAQAAIALTRENEQSAMDAATVEERFELRDLLAEAIGSLEACLMFFRIHDHPAKVTMARYEELVIRAKAAAELKEKANG
jgi:NADH dehydrogenase/NADH:ubiquinone oxidoreductase subunit G